MHTLLSFIFRLVLVAAGLVLAASVAVVATVLAAGWLLRAGWARLTGREVRPFAVRFRMRPDFAASRTPRADAVHPVRSVRGIGDVMDVEPK